MKLKISALICVCVSLIIVAAITFVGCRRGPSPLSEDPIAAIGHGSFLDHNGNQLQLDEKLIRQVQDLYIRQLSDAKLAVREGTTFDEQKIKSTKDLIYNTVKNDVLANAVYIDWLIEQRKPKNEAHFSIVNNALRWRYVLSQKDGLLPDKDNRWSKGIPHDEAGKLEQNGIIVYAITNSGMQAYVQECLGAGVPVPSNMFGGEWTNLGELDNEFISQISDVFRIPLRAELLIHVSTNPEGFCLALPRYLERGARNEAELFGVICLGTTTSKACFFDNPRGRFFIKDGEINFRSSFIGGMDLRLNGQGVCSDCHAGENPYVVHPARDPFRRILDRNLDDDPSDGFVASTMPLRWYDPIVPGDWPQNPGPTNVLDAIPSTQQCNGCHSAGGFGGRLPDLSFPLPEYCVAVLTNAVRPLNAAERVRGTMPYIRRNPPRTPDQQQQERADFVPHINQLTSYCRLTPEDGAFQPGNIPANPSFISPPLIIGPVYACATEVAVRGAVLDARVTLFINGGGGPDNMGFTISPARDPYHLVFRGLPALRPRDELTVRQEIEGGAATSASVTVRNYRDDYRMGPPPPVIDPTVIYACAELIAVRHLPGATITVTTNDMDPRSFVTSSGWSAIPPAGAPFRQRDAFTVEVSICGERIGRSEVVRARPAPTMFPRPEFNPSNTYHGQELLSIENIVYGAKVSLRETGSGWTGSFSTPITWFPNYDIKTAMGRPIQTGDNLERRQGLCAAMSGWTSVESPHDCERLPAPQIERPIGGARFVIVARSVPGARVMVYDSSGNEIGDGSGTVIVLSRAIIAGETLRVVQRVGQCTSRFIYVVRASSGQ
jgi:hypothetical protein